MIEIPNTTNQQRHERFLLTSATVGLSASLIFVFFLIWWIVQPANLPTVRQPIKILNENNRISAGEPIVMELDVSKPDRLDVVGSNRYIRCSTGVLLPLISAEQDLPQGDYTIISDSLILPQALADGDRCEVLFRIEYQINPLRVEVAEFITEVFVVVNPEEGARGPVGPEGPRGPQGPPGERPTRES